jgi:hypothetical protein
MIGYYPQNVAQPWVRRDSTVFFDTWFDAWRPSRSNSGSFPRALRQSALKISLLGVSWPHAGRNVTGQIVTGQIAIRQLVTRRAAWRATWRGNWVAIPVLRVPDMALPSVNDD